MKPKYVICPGEVLSKTDGQRHYVGAMQLMKLYGVDPRECEIHEPAPWWPCSYYMAAEERQHGLPRLRPRYDGKYELHNKNYASWMNGERTWNTNVPPEIGLLRTTRAGLLSKLSACES